MSTDNNQGPIAGAIALAMLDQVEALHAATVALQELVRKDRAEGNAALRQHAAELHEILRKEAGALQLMRRDILGSVQALQALQPGIEGTAAMGVRNALEAGSEKLRDDLERQVAGSVTEFQAAAYQVKGMVRRLTPLWASLLVVGGLLIGITLMYFFVVAGQRRIEEKIDRLQQVVPVAAQPAVAPPPTNGSGRVPQKTHGGRTAAVTKPKPQQPEPVPAPSTTAQP